MTFRTITPKTKDDIAAEEEADHRRYLATATETVTGQLASTPEITHEPDGGRTAAFHLNTGTGTVRIRLTFRDWQREKDLAMIDLPAFQAGSRNLTIRVRGETRQWRGNPWFEAIDGEPIL